MYKVLPVLLELYFAFVRAKIIHVAFIFRPQVMQCDVAGGQSPPSAAAVGIRITVGLKGAAFARVDVPLTSTFMLSTKPGKEAYVEPVIRHRIAESSLIRNMTR